MCAYLCRKLYVTPHIDALCAIQINCLCIRLLLNLLLRIRLQTFGYYVSNKMLLLVDRMHIFAPPFLYKICYILDFLFARVFACVFLIISCSYLVLSIWLKQPFSSLGNKNLPDIIVYNNRATPRCHLRFTLFYFISQYLRMYLGIYLLHHTN